MLKVGGVGSTVLVLFGTQLQLVEGWDNTQGVCKKVETPIARGDMQGDGLGVRWVGQGTGGGTGII